MKGMPPGYEQAPDWLDAAMEPFSVEAKQLLDRAWKKALETCTEHAAELPNPPAEWALSALIGVATQVGMVVIGKAISTHPNVPYDAQANRTGILIHNATVLNFANLIRTLAEANAQASTATKQ